MNIAAYLEEIRTLYNSGQSTEHSFRPALAVINSIGWCEARNCLQNGVNDGKDVDERGTAPYVGTIIEHLAGLTSR